MGGACCCDLSFHPSFCLRCFMSPLPPPHLRQASGDKTGGWDNVCASGWGGGCVTCLPPNTNPPNQQAGGGAGGKLEPLWVAGDLGSRLLCQLPHSHLSRVGSFRTRTMSCPSPPFPWCSSRTEHTVRAQQMIPGRRNRRTNQ